MPLLSKWDEWEEDFINSKVNLEDADGKDLGTYRLKYHSLLVFGEAVMLNCNVRETDWSAVL